MWHEHMLNGSWMMGWGIVPMLLFWLLILSATIFLVKSIPTRRENSSDDSSLQILKDRLASGEIDQQEFDALYQKLKHSQ